MKDARPNRNDPSAASPSAPANVKSKDAPIGVDEQTLANDIARYGSLIANAENVVNKNVNTPLTYSRFGFVNSLIRVFTRRNR